MTYMEHMPNFTPRAQRAINIAKQQAKEFRSESVSLEHLFLGILSLKAGVVHEVLIEVGANPIALMNTISSALKGKQKRNKEMPNKEVKYGTILLAPLKGNK